MPQTKVEWDRRNRVVYAVEDEQGTVRTTGLPRADDADVAWLPVEYVYPENYLPRFPQLLGDRTAYYEVDGVVRGEFIEADFSVAAVRQALTDEMKNHVQRRLARTDWMVIRQVETGQPVPADVSAARQDLRDRAAEVEDEIATVPPAELPTFDYNLPGRLTPITPDTEEIPPAVGPPPGVPIETDPAGGGPDVPPGRGVIRRDR